MNLLKSVLDLYAMKIERWTADIIPNIKTLRELLLNEGLDPMEVDVNSGSKISNKRTTLTEVIIITSGDLIFNLSGTQFALRAGDRLEIAANTLYSYSNLKDKPATLLIAYKI